MEWFITTWYTNWRHVVQGERGEKERERERERKRERERDEIRVEGVVSTKVGFMTFSAGEDTASRREAGDALLERVGVADHLSNHDWPHA